MACNVESELRVIGDNLNKYLRLFEIVVVVARAQFPPILALVLPGTKWLLKLFQVRKNGRMRCRKNGLRLVNAARVRPRPGPVLAGGNGDMPLLVPKRHPSLDVPASQQFLKEKFGAGV